MGTKDGGVQARTLRKPSLILDQTKISQNSEITEQHLQQTQK